MKELVGQVQLLLVLGSQNSSNSRRLAEIGETHGIAAYLIDGVDELQADWFAGVESVLVTAGASAPEILVQEVLQRLEQDFGGKVTEHRLSEEHVHFNLPRELQQLGQR